MYKYWLVVFISLLCQLVTIPVRAESSKTPVFKVDACCQLCPEAQVDAGHALLREGRDGWLFTDASVKNRELASAENQRLLHLLVQQLNAKGSALMLVMPPPRELMYSDKQTLNSNTASLRHQYEQTLTLFRRAGVLVPDYDRLRAAASESEQETFFFKRDSRWTSTGARLTADLVAAEVHKLAEFRPQPEQQFVTSQQGFLKINGELNHQVQALCGGQRYPLEYTPHFVTQRAEAQLASMTNDILLVGSGRSVENLFNFRGFLQQALSRSVINYTASNGNTTAGWLDLLSSPTYQRQRSALILWELPFGERHLSTSLLRQLIALVDDGCEAHPLLSDSVKTVSGNQINDLVFGDALLQAKTKDLVFDLQLSDPSIEQLLLTVWYSDGGRNELQINRNANADHAGRFSFVLGHTPDKTDRLFVSLDLSLAQTMPRNVSVSTRVCRLDSHPLQTAGL
jgi:alginate biosynthesis protein AlgX